ncbi:MAG: hypothetical protein MHPSP_003515 [Paramarteilia canceri]
MKFEAELKKKVAELTEKFYSSADCLFLDQKVENKEENEQKSYQECPDFESLGKISGLLSQWESKTAHYLERNAKLKKLFYFLIEKLCSDEYKDSPDEISILSKIIYSDEMAELNKELKTD